MDTVPEALKFYIAETRKLSGIKTSTEETYYPSIKALLTASLRSNRLPFEVRTGTSEAHEEAKDKPDFVLADAGLFVAVFGEVKLPHVKLGEIAASTENNDQIGRYLAQTGVVLISNVQSFGLLACKPGYKRELGKTVPPQQRELIAEVQLWPAQTKQKSSTRRPRKTPLLSQNLA